MLTLYLRIRPKLFKLTPRPPTSAVIASREAARDIMYLSARRVGYRRVVPRRGERGWKLGIVCVREGGLVDGTVKP